MDRRMAQKEILRRLTSNVACGNIWVLSDLSLNIISKCVDTVNFLCHYEPIGTIILLINKNVMLLNFHTLNQ